MTNKSNFCYEQLRATIQEIDEQINNQLQYALCAAEYDLLHLIPPESEPEEIGEGILDKFALITNKLSILEKEHRVLEENWTKLRNSYKELSEKFHSSQDELALSDGRVTEAVINHNNNLRILKEKNLQVHNLEISYADLQHRFDEVKRSNLKLHIEIQEYKNSIYRLEKEQKQSYSVVPNWEVKVAELDNQEVQTTPNLVKPVIKDNVRSSAEKTSIQEKKNCTRLRNKRIEDLSQQFNCYISNFKLIKQKYQRLPKEQKTQSRAEQAKQQFLSVEADYRTFIDNWEAGWETPQLRELRDEADTELITQANFTKALESTFPYNQNLEIREVNVQVLSEQNSEISIQAELEHSGITAINSEKDLIKADFVKEDSAANETATLNEITNNVQAENSSYNTDNTKSESKIMAVSLTEMLKLMNSTIPEYSGSSGPNSQQELGRFVDCVEMLYKEYEGIPANKAQFLMLLKMKFRGDAYDLINRATFASFEDLKKVLFKTYLPSRNLGEISGELQRCVQRPSETTKEYMRRIRGLFNDWMEQMYRCHEAQNKRNILSEEKEKEVVITFKRGLSNSKLREHLMMNNDVELNTVEESALKYEENTRLFVPVEQLCRTMEQTDPQAQFAYHNYPNARATTNSNPHSLSSPQDGGNMRQESLYAQVGPGNAYGHNEQQRVRCAYCGGFGHTKPRCRKLQERGYCRKCRKDGHWFVDCPERSSNAAGEASPREFFCYDCGQKGHISRNCSGTRNSTESHPQNGAASGNGHVLAQDMGART